MLYSIRRICSADNYGVDSLLMPSTTDNCQLTTALNSHERDSSRRRLRLDGDLNGTPGGDFSGVNQPPVLAEIGNRTIDEGSLLDFLITATDADAGQTLSYALDAGSPPGAAIDPQTGRFTWTPQEAHGPGNFTIFVRVTDNGSPSFSDLASFVLTVNEANNAPVLAPIGNKTVDEGDLVTFTASATDGDVPPRVIGGAGRQPVR